eukprot:scaffold11466_cov99-Skeletonema_dohrnii-CCMP3373.AAC.3
MIYGMIRSHIRSIYPLPTSKRQACHVIDLRIFGRRSGGRSSQRMQGGMWAAELSCLQQVHTSDGSCSETVFFCLPCKGKECDGWLKLEAP